MTEKLYIDIFEKESGVKAFFSTKLGASQGSPYYNSAALEQLGLTEKTLAQPQQVHEAKIGVIGAEKCLIVDESGSVVEEWGRGEEGPVVEAWIQGTAAVAENPDLKDTKNIRFPRTDGVITNQKDVLLTTVHADCLALWFYDKKHQAVGVVHAGWKGTLAGIGPKCVKLMQETYGSDPAEILAYIGPGISKCCFETGPEVIEAFRSQWDFADKYAEAESVIPRWKELAGIPADVDPEKFYIDLKGINTEELLMAGLKKENISVSSHCTCCEPKTFASYRREGGTYMRMGAGICLVDEAE